MRFIAIVINYIIYYDCYFISSPLTFASFFFIFLNYKFKILERIHKVFRKKLINLNFELLFAVRYLGALQF